MKKILSMYVIFSLIFLGFNGILNLMNMSNSGYAEAKSVIYVGGSGPGNYSKIQDAIDNATSGDIIQVWAGIYYENIVINTTISLIGNGSINTTMSKIRRNVSFDQVLLPSTGFWTCRACCRKRI